jgi:hypothetical protein
MVRLHIANSVADLTLGDVQEHLPLERIPLKGDVLGLGTTASLDNGELTFLQEDDGNTAIWKSRPADGGAERLRSGTGLQHFPYVCFSDDATALRHPVPPERLAGADGQRLQGRIGTVIAALNAEGRLPRAPLYGLRLTARWHTLVITVAAKLCLGQQRRSEAQARLRSGVGVGDSIYARLPHFRLSAEDPGDPSDPVRWLGRSLHWEGCGFYDMRPELGRVTVPVADAHLHLHGCSTDLRHGGHLHHEHPGTRLAALERLVLYPLTDVEALAADPAVEDLTYADGEVRFTVRNRGSLDASDIGVAVVVDDRYSSHRWLPLPWLAAGAAERIELPLPLAAGPHRLAVIVDPERRILEDESRRRNNSQELELQI